MAADPNTPAPGEASAQDPSKPKVEVEVARSTGTSVQYSDDGSEPNIDQEEGSGASVEFGTDGKVIGGLTPEELEAEVEKDLQAEDEGGERVPEPEEDAATPGDYPDLGEYNPEDAEARTKFDQRYLTPEGDLNLPNIGGEFWQNYAKAAAAGETPKDHGYLNESAYKYLEDTFKVSRGFITQFEQGQVALAKGRDAEFHASVGGEERWAQAIAWGKTNYTPEQQERFKALQAKGGPEFQEQAELLLSRAERGGALKAAPGEQPQVKQPGRRGSSPRKDATAGAGAPRAAGDTFKSTAEYQEAITEVNMAERNAKTPKEKAEVTARRNSVMAKGRRSGLFGRK